MNSLRDLEKRKLEIKQEIAESKAQLLAALDVTSSINNSLGFFSRSRKSGNFFDKPTNWLYALSGALILAGLRRNWRTAYSLIPVATKFIFPLVLRKKN